MQRTAMLLMTLACHVAAEKRNPTDLRRKAQIARGRATDHAADVMLAKIPGFDLNRSIFADLPGAVSRAMMTTKLEWRPFWNDHAVAEIESEFNNVPVSPALDPELLKFMDAKCDFKVEHADGSFFDHLYFCYDYSVRHYPTASPMVPFLHSILGAGTNYFPMNASHMPELQSFLTEEEWLQVSVFPSFLRLSIQRTLIRELTGMAPEKRAAIKDIKVYRVIDNAPFTLTADQMWTQLNYQLLHELDFLPTSSWDNAHWDPFVGEFNEIRALLASAGQLRTAVLPSATSNFTSYPPGQPPQTAFSIAAKLAPAAVQAAVAHEQAASQVEHYSKLIGHNMTYEITYAA
eukprot:TRINITY_DN16432_c0_g1_i1.p1 TRINITY_DN16432_c0_g1~~TRINITY_DN16432_c0_g1_i1.p1  ORF type:complete len:347 (+),score=99.61 TRINITY_DN16432_c0_g1_i1:57-1097(+)